MQKCSNSKCQSVLYRTHGANLAGLEHHQMLARELSLSAGLLRRRETLIRKKLRWLNDALRGYRICDKTDRVFDLD